jgi:uncharacterized GH25 family protein
MTFVRHFLLIAFMLTAQPSFGHVLFLVVPDHDVPANTQVEIALVNGTFDKSENAISRSRMVDVTYLDGDGKRVSVPTSAWRDEDLKAIVSLNSGGEGTALLGVSTGSRLIEMSAEDFNRYLRNDGVLDTLEARRAAGTLDNPARESYAKHVKTLLRVGGGSSDAWQTVLGYPVELVPLSNPFELRSGDTLRLKVLASGKALPNQLVFASHENFHGHGDDGSHEEAEKARSDKQGVVEIPVSEPGRWYVRLIHMVEDESEEYDYISEWATLTFEVAP